VEHDNHRDIGTVVGEIDRVREPSHQCSSKSLIKNPVAPWPTLNAVESSFNFAEKIFAESAFLPIIPLRGFGR
jgi:hypothetical protein